MNENILIVEDDEEIAMAIKEYLEKSGYSAVWASTGREGIDEFKKEDFQLCIIDIMMPENPKRTFTKKELYEFIWNEENLDGNNTVTVHIKSLREKLKDNPKTPRFIETVWGIGYKFIGEIL